MRISRYWQVWLMINWLICSDCLYRKYRWRTCRTTETLQWEFSTRTRTDDCLARNSVCCCPSTSDHHTDQCPGNTDYAHSDRVWSVSSTGLDYVDDADYTDRNIIHYYARTLRTNLDYWADVNFTEMLCKNVCENLGTSECVTPWQKRRRKRIGGVQPWGNYSLPIYCRFKMERTHNFSYKGVAKPHSLEIAEVLEIVNFKINCQAFAPVSHSCRQREGGYFCYFSYSLSLPFFPSLSPFFPPFPLYLPFPSPWSAPPLKSN